MMSRMLLSMSSSCVLVFLLCLVLRCHGSRHLSTKDDDHAMDDKPKPLTHSTIKGFGKDVLKVQDDHNLETTAKGKDQGSNKKDKIKFQKVKKVKEVVHRHQRQHHHKSVTFKVPPRNKQVHQQPGFNLDYSPPKTHPPSHN